jgi:hypothetical protein
LTGHCVAAARDDTARTPFLDVDDAGVLEDVAPVATERAYEGEEELARVELGLTGERYCGLDVKRQRDIIVTLSRQFQRTRRLGSFSILVT